MGDPRKPRKKYEIPQRLWDADRIIEERSLVNDYGLKNIREVWIAKAELRKIRREARKLLALGEKGEKEELLNRAVRMGYAPKGATIDNLLAITTRSILDRRLQTLVFRAGLANSLKQARQLITHGHITLNGRKVTAPGMLIPVDLEGKLAYRRAIKLPTPKKKPKEAREERREERKEEKLKETIKKLSSIETETAAETETQTGIEGEQPETTVAEETETTETPN